MAIRLRMPLSALFSMSCPRRTISAVRLSASLRMPLSALFSMSRPRSLRPSGFPLRQMRRRPCFHGASRGRPGRRPRPRPRIEPRRIEACSCRVGLRCPLWFAGRPRGAAALPGRTAVDGRTGAARLHRRAPGAGRRRGLLRVRRPRCDDAVGAGGDSRSAGLAGRAARGDDRGGRSLCGGVVVRRRPHGADPPRGPQRARRGRAGRVAVARRPGRAHGAPPFAGPTGGGRVAGTSRRTTTSATTSSPISSIRA